MPRERQMERAEEPQERCQLALSCAEKARGRPELDLHDTTHMWVYLTWKPSRALQQHYGQGLCPSSQEDSSAQGQKCPKEASQLLPCRLWCSPVPQQRQEELTAKAATGTRAEVTSPGRREEHQHLGRNKLGPTHPCKSLCSRKWRVTCFKNKKYLMKMNHDLLWQGRITPEQLPQLSWAPLCAW